MKTSVEKLDVVFGIVVRELIELFVLEVCECFGYMWFFIIASVVSITPVFFVDFVGLNGVPYHGFLLKFGHIG